MSSEKLENQACVAFVTCGNTEEAEKIAEAIVTERLAACVNILGEESKIRSFYIWEDQFQKESEILLIIKTTPKQLPQLEVRIQELHSYEVPEFIVLPVIFGGQSYIQWIKSSVNQS